MALIQIPLSPLPDSTFTIELDRVVYQIRILRNDRTEVYALSIFTEAGEPIVHGVPLLVNYPLLARFADERLPPGGLFLWDSTGRLREMTDATIGIEHLLLYQEAS